MNSEITWKVINSQFKDNYQYLVRHHIESYNHFFNDQIFQIFKENNPLFLGSDYNQKTQQFKNQCVMYFGGKDGSKIYFGKPTIYDGKDNFHNMYPNEARLRNMNYAMTIHYDVEVEFITILDETELKGGHSNEFSSFSKINMKNIDDAMNKFKMEGGVKASKRKNQDDVEMTTSESNELKETYSSDGKVLKRIMTLKKMYLGKFPIMLQSDFCILRGLSRETRFSMGECKNDIGGYFIVDGKEKTVVCQEKFADNMLYIHEANDDTYLYKAEIRSISENVSKPMRNMFVGVVAPDSKYKNKNIVVNIPNVRKPMPLFIVFRALGIISDKSIITHCLCNLEKYDSYLQYFESSVYDACSIMTQQAAIKYIATFTKWKTTEYTMEILSDYFLPHIGENNYKSKALFLGHMVKSLLDCYSGNKKDVDRDSFKYKRIETAGSLMYDLFREYYIMQLRTIHLEFEKRLLLNQSLYENNLIGLVNQFYVQIFSDRVVESGFKKGFKGNWGATAHTKRIGVLQELNYLTHASMLSHLRKTNLHMDSGAKVVGPRVLHGSHWGFFDPIDTPDGGNIGLHKHMSISAYVTRGISRTHIINWLNENTKIELIENVFLSHIDKFTKVFVNGYMHGIVKKPYELIDTFKIHRRNGLIPIYTSINFELTDNLINIYCDGGRICRPIFYKDGKNMSFENKSTLAAIEKGTYKWNDLITGFNEKKIENYHPNDYNMYSMETLYGLSSSPTKLQSFIDNKGVIDYIDNSESDSAMIALKYEDYLANKDKYTHMEIHESLILGVMCNLIPYPENNPATRNSFSCGQSKQATSLVHTNYQLRMDKSNIILNNGQIPLVKTRYMEHINNEENVYGVNTMVAIMTYTSYNVEDAVLVNEGSLQRGMFNTTYFSTYSSHEESEMSNGETISKVFTNIENDPTVMNLKAGYDYSFLDANGVVKEGTQLNEKVILIGNAVSNSSEPGIKMDNSTKTKKGQLGVVDKTYITEGEEGKRLCKIRVRETRIPNLGDKFASRAGQKGTVGLVIPEENMPFMKNGMRPDIIVNPHALPSRMTIGQLVETITGKASAHYGGFGDSTAFINKGSKIKVMGNMLNKAGYHSSGNEILYNGMTGEQLESEIFMGPTYYMRLKHMVKDKINFRALGPRNVLTRQPVSGRANDGGLRIGEMERDGVISHGASAFLKDSMMTRGDKYKFAVCNQSGLVAIYNPDKKLFFSPLLDGPLKYTGSLAEDNLRIENVTQHGRDFSVISVPYTFKLLFQELQAINVQMRIITEDNISHIENMHYSNNIKNIMQSENDDIKELIKELIDGSNAKKFQQKKLQSTPQEEKDDRREKEIEKDDKNFEVDELFRRIYIRKYPEADERHIKDAYSIFLKDGIITKPILIPRSPEDTPPGPTTPPDTPPGTPPDTPPATEDSYYVPATPEDYERLPSPEKRSITDLDSPPFAPDLDSPPFAPDVNDEDFTTKYEKGDKVNFRGDFKTDRVWSIKNVSKKFITIETEDQQGLDENNYVKVVTPLDISKLKTIPHNEPHSQPLTPISSLENSNQPMSGGAPPAINFAPVFNMNGGKGDVEIGADTSAKIPMNILHGSGEPVQQESNTVLSGGHDEKEFSTNDLTKNAFTIKKVD